jgi:hypothetical protein
MIKELPKLSHSDIWKGSYKGLDFKIQRWSNKYKDSHSFEYNWNYYIYFREATTKDFELNWLEDKVVTWGITHDYYNTPIAQGDWHGGVTFYQKHVNIPSRRVVEFGCDFMHLWDMERGMEYSLDEVFRECLETIDSLEHLIITPSIK